MAFYKWVVVNVHYFHRRKKMIGKRLQEIRNKRNYSLRKLAGITGLSHSFICDIEHNRCKPSIDNLQVLAKAFEVGPEYFLTETSNES